MLVRVGFLAAKIFPKIKIERAPRDRIGWG
jgi:hypothetical protein